MRVSSLCMLLCLGVVVPAAAAPAEVTVKAARWPDEGWMAGGYGAYSFTFMNDGQVPAKVTKWTAYWEIEGKPFGEQWGGDLDIGLPPGKETVKNEGGSLPVEVVNKSRPGKPVMAGVFTVQIEGKAVQLPFRLEVPAAELPEKTRLYKGKFVGIELMPSHFKTFRGRKRMLRWMDQDYEAMHELTGYSPDGGRMLLIKESPKHPYWAYVEGSGLPIILNTSYVDGVLQGIDKGVMPFGWVHEMGHYFDIFGKWYFWGGASVEWQGNWKVCYAFETIPDRSFKAPWNENKTAAYQPGGKEVLLEGRHWVDAYFLFFGDPYLADPSRKWDSMSSDELHSFFQRLVRVYGWEPFKRWYRTYERFEKLGLKEPGTPEGTIQLIAAILSKETGADLVPVFQRWRMPVTHEDVEAMNKKYPIQETSAREKQAAAHRTELNLQEVKPMTMEVPQSVLPLAGGDGSAGAAPGNVTVSAVCIPTEGWMADGFGKYNFTFRNDGQVAVRVTKWTAYWNISGKPFGEQWGGDLGIDLPPGKEATKSEITRLPIDVIEKSRPGVPLMAGSFTVQVNSANRDLAFRLAVPEATLPEKIQLFKGKHVGVELMPSRLEKFKAKDRLVRWLDQVYDAMQDLTGYTPIEGRLVVIREVPEHPWFAYVDGAGKPIMMNTKRIEGVLKGIDNAVAPFGWVHEIGHFFDVLGKWYFWGAPSVEWQGNWKVCYAYETVPDRSFKAPWTENKTAAYQPGGKEVLLDGRQFVDSFFLFFGDLYLADPSRKWDSMSSDELHSFFQRLARVYGWEPFKRWYRTYERFEKLGLKEPGTPEGTIQLIAAILSKETGADLVPVFQRWRMPVTQEDIEAMNKNYPI